MHEQENREQATGTLSSQLTVLALGPRQGRTPWWARRLEFSHIVLIKGDVIWDQPFKGAGKAYSCHSWLAVAGDRESISITIEVGEPDGIDWINACASIENRQGQPIRTILRYLRLWPHPSWNCTSPVRILLEAIGVYVSGETPDAIIKELAEEIRFHRSNHSPFPYRTD